MSTSASPPSRAFVAVEALTLVAMLCVLAAFLSLAANHARTRSRTAGSMANLQKFASGITSFAADNEDRILSFSWRAGAHTDRTGYVFPISNTDRDAASDQAVAIMRWHAQRTDITTTRSWIPHLTYTHLALIEHLEHTLPADFAVSPHDLYRQAWKRSVLSPREGEQGSGFLAIVNRPAVVGNDAKRWPYSSSYEFAPATFTPDAITFPKGGGSIATLSQDPQGHRFFQPGALTLPWGRRRVSEVSYPGAKVLAYETHPAGDGGSLGQFYAASRSPAPMLFADGSVSLRQGGAANPGFSPNIPNSNAPTRINYAPELSWEPPTPNGATSVIINGGVRWTRSGLRGRDFDGPEVPWGG